MARIWPQIKGTTTYHSKSPQTGPRSRPIWDYIAGTERSNNAYDDPYH